MIFAVAAALLVMALGGVAFAFAGGDRTQKRLAGIAGKSRSSGRASRVVDPTAARKKNVQTMLKDLEAKQLARLRRRRNLE